MRTIVHVSDLHYGRVDPEVEAALTRAINQVKPDLIAVSGDFTQRARAQQFAAALAWVKSFGVPWIGLPGNHDVPIWGSLERLVMPFARYRLHVSSDLEPTFDDGQLCVVSLNSTRRMSRRLNGFWKDGVLRPMAVERACRVLRQTSASIRVVITHHPLRAEHARHQEEVVEGARAALIQLAQAGADAILYGHLHTPHALRVQVDHDLGRRVLLCVMAGTAASVRRREQPNSFNVLRFNENRLKLTRMDFVSTSFEPSKESFFNRTEVGWLEEEPPLVANVRTSERVGEAGQC